MATTEAQKAADKKHYSKKKKEGRYVGVFLYNEEIDVIEHFRMSGEPLPHCLKRLINEAIGKNHHEN